MINNWLETLLSFNFTIVHRPGILHILPDAISRFYDFETEEQEEDREYLIWAITLDEEIEWKMSSKIFEKIATRFGRCGIDAFASARAHILPVYFTKEMDALKQAWRQERLWMFPPVDILAKVTRKIRTERTRATLVTPYLPKELWFQECIKMTEKKPLRLFIQEGIMERIGGGVNAIFPWDSLIIWDIDGKKQRSDIDFSPEEYNQINQEREPEQLAPPLELPRRQLIEFLDPAGVEQETPEGLRQSLVQRAHLGGHFGGASMFKALRFNGHFWQSMKGDCDEEFKKCIKCQRFVIGKHGFHPLSNISARLPFDHVAMDLKEFPRSDRGNSYILVLVDVATRFAFLRVLMDKSMYSVAAALFGIFCDVGFPRIIQSDNGTEFVNSVIAELLKLSHTDQRLITAYHPRANGLAERWVRTVSEGIYKLLLGKDNRWDRFVPSVQYFTNIKVTNIHNSSPFSLMFARKANEFAKFDGEEKIFLNQEELQSRMNYMATVVYPTIFEKAAKNKDIEAQRFIKNNLIITTEFHPGAVVMIKNDLRAGKTEPRSEGPFSIVRRTRAGSYILRGEDGTEYTRAPNQIRLISQQAVDDKEFSKEVEIEEIRDQKEEGNANFYLIKWKGLPESLNQWVAEDDIVGQEAIRKFWKKRKVEDDRGSSHAGVRRVRFRG
jgi:transposase InsO family protein